MEKILKVKKITSLTKSAIGLPVATTTLMFYFASVFHAWGIFSQNN
jgi:hypothetical protein